MSNTCHDKASGKFCSGGRTGPHAGSPLGMKFRGDFKEPHKKKTGARSCSLCGKSFNTGGMKQGSGGGICGTCLMAPARAKMLASLKSDIKKRVREILECSKKRKEHGKR